MKTLILIPAIGISIGTILFLAVHFLRWLGNLLDTNDTAAFVFAVGLIVILAVMIGGKGK